MTVYFLLYFLGYMYEKTYTHTHRRRDGSLFGHFFPGSITSFEDRIFVLPTTVYNIVIVVGFYFSIFVIVNFFLLSM